MSSGQTLTASKKTPPYVAYKTFISFVDSLKKAVPGRIDRSVMHTMSGGTQSHMMHALRTMDLVTESGITTESLKALVLSEGEERKKTLLQNCLFPGYPFLFTDPKIDIGTATGKQLLEQFENVGLRGDSIRRSVAFFLAGAKDAGIKLSPYFNKIQARSGAPKPRANNGVTSEESDGEEGAAKPKSPKSPPHSPRTADQNEWTDRLLSKFPEFDPEWSPEIQLKWFEAFDRLMKGRGL